MKKLTYTLIATAMIGLWGCGGSEKEVRVVHDTLVVVKEPKEKKVQVAEIVNDGRHHSSAPSDDRYYSSIPAFPRLSDNTGYHSRSDDPFAWLSQRRVTYNDLAGLSLNDKQILRNAIFARHGYSFRLDYLRRYFEQYTWYEAYYSNVSNYLSSTETYNVNFILRNE